MVDRLDLAYLDEPDLDVLGGSHQDAVTMVLRLTQNLSRVCRSLRLFEIKPIIASTISIISVFVLFFCFVLFLNFLHERQ